jgi:NAD(P)-dependent dehydrogenase (short-subunit alcohol dehydrogenase family)
MLLNDFRTEKFISQTGSESPSKIKRKSERSSIINVSSEVGSLTALSTPGGNPSRDKFYAYGSSRTALNVFTL